MLSTSIDSIPSSHSLFTQPQPTPSNLSIPQAPGGLSVGIVWATDSIHYSGLSNKSICLDSLLSILLPLVDLDLIDLHSLQVGSSSSDITPFLRPNRIFDWSPLISDFSDTAYIANQLDLVITIDTAVAHLTASLNIPTWVLLPFDSDFRWLTDCSDSPWYPQNVRLFRQQQANDWHFALQELKTVLNRLFLVNLSDLASAKI